MQLLDKGKRILLHNLLRLMLCYHGIQEQLMSVLIRLNGYCLCSLFDNFLIDTLLTEI